MKNRRFLPARRSSSRLVKYNDQFAIIDGELKLWTPMFVFPLVARDFANMLELGKKDIADFEWEPDDGRWNHSWLPDRKKFDVLDENYDSYYDIR